MKKMNPVVHFEMPAEDRKRIADFYTNVFGWETKQLGPEMGNYVLANTDETDKAGMLKKTNRINGGFYQKEEGDAVPHIVIAVEDLDKHIETVNRSGGKTIGQSMDIPGIGKFIMFTDSEGNRVGMLQPVIPM